MAKWALEIATSSSHNAKFKVCDKIMLYRVCRQFDDVSSRFNEYLFDAKEKHTL